MIQLSPKVIVSKQEHSYDGNVDLCHYGFFASSEEAVYLEVLSDPFKDTSIYYLCGYMPEIVLVEKCEILVRKTYCSLVSEYG